MNHCIQSEVAAEQHCLDGATGMCGQLIPQPEPSAKTDNYKAAANNIRRCKKGLEPKLKELMGSNFTEVASCVIQVTI